LQPVGNVLSCICKIKIFIVDKVKIMAKLTDIAQINVGFLVKGRLEHIADGVPVVQLKDIRQDALIDFDGLDRADLSGYKETHLANEGDVLVRTRGEWLGAAVVPGGVQAVLVAAPVMRIVVDRQCLLPQYLCWIINNQPGQAYFQSIAEESVVKMLSKSALLNMDIPLLPLAEQQKIVDLDNLRRQQKELELRLQSKQESLINAQILRYIATK
jgi:hypothetical protein